VIDNGVGLAKHNRSRLLEPYVTTKAKGTGLGLAIVHKVVEQHGGVLTLEDAPPAPGRNRGALVRIALPMRTGETTPGTEQESIAAE
jgi:two-component system nitrogen regulation sensor histidine kinase NtrY